MKNQESVEETSQILADIYDKLAFLFSTLSYAELKDERRNMYKECRRDDELWETYKECRDNAKRLNPNYLTPS